MPKPIHVVLGVLALLAAGSVAWLLRVVMRGEPQLPGPRTAARPAAVAPALVYAAEPIGIAEGDHPAITDLVIADLDGDALPDVVLCDATENQVSWIRQSPRGQWTERVLPVPVHAPVRLIAGDFTGDGRTDLLVGCAGRADAGDDRSGSVWLIEQPSDATAAMARPLLDHVWPVTDLRVLDRRQDGGLMLVVATAGRQQGRLHFIERLAAGTFRSEVLADGGRMIGLAVQARADAPAVVASLEDGQRELTRLHRRNAAGSWESEVFWTAPQPDWAGAALAWADLNRDGVTELIVANGDRLERYPDPGGGQGLHGLDAAGGARSLQTLASFPGCHGFALADLNGDQRTDLVSVSTASRPLDPAASTAVVWINRGADGFERVPLPGAIDRVSAVAVGDLDGDGAPEIITGAHHDKSPAEKSGRVTLWRRQAP